MTSIGIERRPSPASGRAEHVFWDTQEPLSEEFARDWRREVGGSPHAHFEFDLEYLAWEAQFGRHGRALMIGDGERRGVVVLRRHRGRWISGWPWRWNAFMCGADPASPLGMSAADAAWLHAHTSKLAGPQPLTFYLPHPPADGVPGWVAGATVLHDLFHSDAELLNGMEPSKRRLVRRAHAHDITIRVGGGEGDYRSFHRVQQQARARRGLRVETTPERIGARGVLWREWELPWMWLLVARQRDEVVAGVGDGVLRGGVLQGRAAASTLGARRLGATVLLGYEEARRGRDQGHRWLNHGGDTPFKREMCGRLGRSVRMFGWSGGGRAWRLWQRGEAAIMNLRPALARWRRQLGRLRAGAGSRRNFLLGLAWLVNDNRVWG